jgi:hypothetical protein
MESYGARRVQEKMSDIFRPEICGNAERDTQNLSSASERARSSRIATSLWACGWPLSG